jgi:hypothetical protein
VLQYQRPMKSRLNRIHQSDAKYLEGLRSRVMQFLGRLSGRDAKNRRDIRSSQSLPFEKTSTAPTPNHTAAQSNTQQTSS